MLEERINGLISENSINQIDKKSLEYRKLCEFYATADPDDLDLQDRLDEWVFHYNWLRGHGSLGGKAPIDRIVERSPETPITDEVEAMYDPSKERIKEANYSLDLQISKLKGCL